MTSPSISSAAKKPMAHTTISTYQWGVHVNGGHKNIFIHPKNQVDNFFNAHPVEFAFAEIRKKFDHTSAPHILFGANQLENADKDAVVYVPSGDKIAEDFAKAAYKTHRTRLAVTQNIRNILENKVTGAEIVSKLRDTDFVRDALKNYGDKYNVPMTQDIMDKTIALSRSFFPETGVISSKDGGTEADVKNDILTQAKKQLAAGKGIVFQAAKAAGGMGTALYSKSKLEKIMQSDDPAETLFKDIDNQFRSKSGIAKPLLEEIADNKLSWQEMVTFEKEISLGYGQNNNDFEPHYFTEQFTTNKGEHTGNKVMPLGDLESFGENGQAINMLTKLFIDLALKDNNIPEGLDALYDRQNQSDCLEMFGIDLFQTKDKKTLIFSELNARPTAATRTFNTASGIDKNPEIDYTKHDSHLVLKTEKLKYMTPEIQDALRSLGKEKAGQYMFDVLSPIMKKAPYARPTGNLFAQPDSDGNIKVRAECFFPYPTKDCRFEQNIMHDVEKALHELDSDMIGRAELPPTTLKHMKTMVMPHTREEPSKGVDTVLSDAAKRFAKTKITVQEAPF